MIQFDDNQNTQRRNKDKRKKTPNHEIDIAPQTLKRRISFRNVTTVVAIRLLRISKTVNGPEMMTRQETGDENQ